MADTPVTIKDYDNIVSTTRKELLEEEKDKIIGKKGFIFTTFKTEKQRIEEYVNQQNTIYSKVNTNQLSASDDYQQKSQFLQPSMRYKPRTDLERVFDTINKYSFGRVSKEIVDRQLKSLDLTTNKQQIVQEQEELDFDNCILEVSNCQKNKVKMQTDIEKQMETRDKIRAKRKEFSMIRRRKFVDNSSAKQVMSELHNKTHFKAATGFTLFNNRTLLDFRPERTKRASYQRNEEDIPCIITQSQMNEDSSRYTAINTDSTCDDYEYLDSKATRIMKKKDARTTFSQNFLSQDKLGRLSERLHSKHNLNFEIEESNPILTNLNFNPIKKAKMIEEKENLDYSKLDALKKIAFGGNRLSEIQNINKSTSSSSISKNLAKISIRRQNSRLVSSKIITESTLTHNPAYFFQKIAENPKLVEDIMVKEEFSNRTISR